MSGYSPINMKSAVIDTGSLSANTIYRLRRSVPEVATPDFDNDPYAELNVADNHGMIFQNNTTGVIYLWYGRLPAAYQDPAVFKNVALKLAAGESFEPPMSQIGLLYGVFATPAAGFIHHLYH